MQREKSGFFQIGLALLICGVAVRVIIALSETLLGPLSGIAIGIGVVLMILGLVLPGRR